MNKMTLIVVLLAAQVFAAGVLPQTIVTANAAERVAGTRVRMEPPPGFEKTTQFFGYVQKETGASIMVMQMPGPYEQISASFTEEGLRSQGMELISSQDISVSGNTGMLLYAAQNAYGRSFKKWTLIFGAGMETAIINATFPAEVEDQLSDPLMNTLLGVTWDSNAAVDMNEGLTFKIEPQGDFKVASKIGNSLVLTEQGVFPLKSPDDPMIVVGASLSEDMNIDDKAKFARDRLSQSADLSGARVILDEGVTIDSLEGRRIIAEAKDVKSDNAKFIYYAMLFSEDGYYLYLGMAPANRTRDYQDVFASTLESFKQQDQ